MPPEKGVSPGGALLRSIVIPGWGQWRTGHPVKGSVMLGGVTGFGLAALIEHGRVLDDTERANAAATEEEFDRIVAERQDHIASRDRFVSWLVLLWLYNALDAYIEGHFVDFEGLEFLTSGRHPRKSELLPSPDRADAKGRIRLVSFRRAF